jgi:hypothetical protein
MQILKFDPDSVIGQKYERGLLPFGGSVNSSGIITFAMSEQEFDREMGKLSDLG